MHITDFLPEYVDAAARLYSQNFKRLREYAPLLPDTLENPAAIADKLNWLTTNAPGVAVWENGQLVGYLGWFLVDQFRRTNRRGAYMAEWGHAAVESQKSRIYRAMYRTAAEQMEAARAQVHAITLLANDAETEKVWYWSGFGLTVVDAIRPMQPFGAPKPTGVTIRKANATDAPRLAQIDEEHCRHYTQPPTFMVLPPSDSAEQFADFLEQPGNSVWIAEDRAQLAGFMRFNAGDYDGVEILNAPGMVGINAAYVRPEYRGRGIAPAILDAGLAYYAEQGVTRCTTNFESLNPEASALWMRYFQPVAYSLTRVPEREPQE